MSNDLFSLKDQTVLVIGAAGILGPVFCDGMARAGANIAMVDLVAPQDAAEILSADHGIKAMAYAFDLRAHEGLKNLVDTIEADMGAIDVLHINAASKGKDLTRFFAADEDYDIETWREIMGVNIDSAFFVAMAVGKRMVMRGRGSIIMTGSIYGIMGPDQRIYEGSQYLGQEIRSPAVYSTSKAGLIGLARHLAAMWGGDGVRVNVLVPGGVASGQNDVFEKKYSSRVPMGRMASPEEMVGALIFLASGASSYVTGQVISVDGGLGCW